MIISDAGFVIATPTKCGTTTIEHVAKRHNDPSFAIAAEILPRRQHRMVMPTEAAEAGYRKMLLVRNPFTRYMSVYEYLRAPQNYSQWGARWVQGRLWPGKKYGEWMEQDPMTFEEFLQFLIASRTNKAVRKKRDALDQPRAYRSPWVWTDSLAMSYQALLANPGRDGVTLLRMESLWADLSAINHRYGVGIDLKPIHANRNKHYGSRDLRQYWAIGCKAKKVKKGGFLIPDLEGKAKCDCVVCSLGVVTEAQMFGYQYVGAAQGSV